MKRIAYLSDARYEGGAERYLIRLAGNLDRNTWSPVLLLPASRNLDDLAGLAETRGIEVRRHEPGGFAGTRSPLALGALIRGARADLVHLNLPSTYDLGCGLAAPVARAAGARAVVTTEHIADILPSRRRILAKQAGLSSIDRVIAISTMHGKLLVERHRVPERKIRVIYNGVEDPGLCSRHSSPTLGILCVGVIEHRKGQDLLVDSVETLLSRGHDVRLVLVGDGPERGALEARVRRSAPLQDRVVFTGILPSVWPEFAVADVVAIPSRIEGLPFTILEGFAAGAAVAAAALPGMDEVIDHGRTGLIVPASTRECWADTLSGLALNPEIRLRLAHAGRQEYEKRFTIGRMVEETQALYSEVLR